MLRELRAQTRFQHAEDQRADPRPDELRQGREDVEDAQVDACHFASGRGGFVAAAARAAFAVAVVEIFVNSFSSLLGVGGRGHVGGVADVQGRGGCEFQVVVGREAGVHTAVGAGRGELVDFGSDEGEGRPAADCPGEAADCYEDCGKVHALH